MEKSSFDDTIKEFDIDIDELRKELIEEDNFITDLINTFPPKMYFDQEVQDKITANKHALMDEAAKGLKRSFPGQQEMTSKSKHKRARLDPHQHKSVWQIQQEIEKKEFKPKKNLTVPSASLTRAANVEELQRRLQERIRELQGKRKSCTDAEFVEKKRLKKKVKKMKNKKKGNLVKENLNGKVNGVQKQKKKLKPAAPVQVFNKEGKVIYSKFDFSETGNESTKQNQHTGKNYKKLLLSVEKKNEKIEQIKETDADKANSMIQKSAWKRAILKAEGVKLKDDPVLLKKSLKHQEKQKNRSSKAWKGRIDHTEQKMKDRQDKRTKNIKAKKQEKFDKKIKYAKKKGRIIPGF